MRSPLSDHVYGQHASVLPPQDQTRHDGDDIDLAVRKGLYRSMREMRVFEKRAYDLFMKQLVKGTSHLSLGMEAIAAGFGQAMRADDYTFATGSPSAFSQRSTLPVSWAIPSAGMITSLAISRLARLRTGPIRRPRRRACRCSDATASRAPPEAHRRR